MLSRAAPGGRLSRGRRWTGTVDGDRGNTALSVDAARLLKTQDAGYLRTARNVAAREARRLEERAVLAAQFAGETGVDMEDDEEEDDEDELEAGRTRTRRAQPRKIVFVDPADLDGIDDDGDRNPDGGATGPDGEANGPAEKAARLRRKLQSARKRLRALTDAETELDLQRARMAKTPTVGGVTKRGRKFKIRERKR